MSYSNGLLSGSSSQSTRGQQGQQGPQGPQGPQGLPCVGFKLTSSGHYDLANKRLTNVADGVASGVAVTKGQLDKKPDSTAVLLLNGQNHMTGDLDMRGKKILLPGEINMSTVLQYYLQVLSSQHG